MTAISAQFKVYASIDMKHLMKSKVQLQVLHSKGWRPLFEFTAQDIMKIFNNQKPTSKKGKLK